MLNKELFKNGLEELQNAFSRFELDEKKIKIWYKYSKYLTDGQWEEKIEKCIRFCRKIPTLADILDLSGYYKKEDDWSEVRALEDDYKHTDRPEKITKEVYKILGKTDPKYRDRLGKLA